MSVLSAAALAASAAPPSQRSLSVVRASVLGAGSIWREFGHAIATNPAGEVLLAARLNRVETGTVEPAGSLDLSTGSIVKLASDGAPAWRLPLRGAGLLGSSHAALDDLGAAYIAAPCTPDVDGLRGEPEVALTKIAPGGQCQWTRRLFPVRLRDERPAIASARVATEPAGRACVTWLGERRGVSVVQAMRVSAEGGVEWEYVWPITGRAGDPQAGVDASGAAAVWGTLLGHLSFAPAIEIASGQEVPYVVRVEPDGRVAWARAVGAAAHAPCALALGRNGTLALAIGPARRPAHRRAARVPLSVHRFRRALAIVSPSRPPAPGDCREGEALINALEDARAALVALLGGTAEPAQVRALLGVPRPMPAKEIAR